MYDFFESNFETSNWTNVGKIDRVAENFLLNPTRYDPFDKKKIKRRFIEDLINTSMLEEEEDTDSYREDVTAYKYESQSIPLPGLLAFLFQNPDEICDRVKIIIQKNPDSKGYK